MRTYTGDMVTLIGEQYLPIAQAHSLFVNPANDLGVKEALEEALKGFVVPEPDPTMEEMMLLGHYDQGVDPEFTMFSYGTCVSCDAKNVLIMARDHGMCTDCTLGEEDEVCRNCGSTEVYLHLETGGECYPCMTEMDAWVEELVEDDFAEKTFASIDDMMDSFEDRFGADIDAMFERDNLVNRTLTSCREVGWVV